MNLNQLRILRLEFIYSPSPEVQKAFVRGLYGEFKFVGKSPVELDGDE